ncbi:hypothetical protein SAMN05880561_106177 [Rhizobium sp. RU33A]|uniref:hypothetical protein n=1 Tax=Rhizobium sp. RU33A TaxID=1907413 RepID=UPI000954737F|nr:hypothetical protein [Rhizobium sp. RU33A]SIQ95870.1 hypothetical protein SAMN05880561_106177 [Rhizobium sp. RU33A]
MSRLRSIGITAVAAMVGFIPAKTLLAADLLEPVKIVMSAAGWKDKDAPKVEASGYFDDRLLATIYSASFVDIYRLAEKKDALQDSSGYMLGYDVVIGGQDSCELKDVRIEARPARDGVTPVNVYFDAVSCFGHAPDLSRPQTVFHVVEEDGRYVIDNLWNDSDREGALESSVKAQFAAMIKAYLDFRLTGSWPKD